MAEKSFVKLVASGKSKENRLLYRTTSCFPLLLAWLRLLYVRSDKTLNIRSVVLPCTSLLDLISKVNPGFYHVLNTALV